MKVGDLIEIGWNGPQQQPFVAIIKKVHRFSHEREKCYTVFIPATGKETFITERDVQVLDIEVINESR